MHESCIHHVLYVYCTESISKKLCSLIDPFQQKIELPMILLHVKRLMFTFIGISVQEFASDYLKLSIYYILKFSHPTYFPLGMPILIYFIGRKNGDILPTKSST